ncbi:palmitoyltransferase ZDHHC6-like [Penaeus indicus]|uniref:palmitoyltransferase ZDHHC6-like n=1 Tax=Penaeus indicus TaxID=29960 RepID=UPI00300D20D9
MRWENFCQVLRPFREPAGDGIVWPVAEGCDQYTLTTEQLAQKAEKRARSRLYEIVEPFSGWWFPCTKGVCVCCHPPCTDEPRLPLRVGQEVVVTRWKRYWLYGERKTSSSTLPSPPPPLSSSPLPSSSSSLSSPPPLPPPSSSSSSSATRHRGWFPRRCAVQVMYEGKKTR